MMGSSVVYLSKPRLLLCPSLQIIAGVSTTRIIEVNIIHVEGTVVFSCHICSNLMLIHVVYFQLVKIYISDFFLIY